MTEKDYKIERTEWEEGGCQIRITGVDNEVEAEKVIRALETAEVIFDRVFVEFERVYECLYDCLFGRLVTA